MLNAQDSTFNDQQPSRKKDSFSKIEGSLGAVVVIPSPGMKAMINNDMGNLGYGLSLQVIGSKKPSTLKWGGNFSYTYFGRYLTDVSGGDALKTTYGLTNLNGVIRLTLKEPTNVTLYVDFFLGVRTYFSRTKWHFASSEEEPLLRVVRTGFNRGAAAGINFGKYKGAGLRFSYQWSGDARYVVRNSVQYTSGNNITYETAYAPITYGAVSLVLRFD
jgi:hypothetical protein